MSRRPPHAGVGMNGSPADSQIPTDQPAPTDSSPNFMPMVGIGPPATSNSILPVGMSGMLPGSPSDQSGHMTRVSVGSSSMPMPMSAMPPPSTGNSVMPSSSAGNMLPGDNQHLQRNNSNNSLPSTMNDMHNSMMYSQYPTNSQTSASSYEFPQANYFGSSQCQESAEYGMYAPRGYLPHNQFNRYPWPGHQPSPPYSLNMNRPQSTHFNPVYSSGPYTNNQQDNMALANLDHVARMKTPLVLPPLDPPDRPSDGYNSDISLPSLDDDQLS